MASREVWNTGKLFIAFLLFFILIGVFLHADKIPPLLGDCKGETRIIQTIQPQSDCRTYTITTYLQHFDKQWHTINTWRTNGSSDVIIRIKTLHRDKAEGQQRCLKKDLKEFYNH